MVRCPGVLKKAQAEVDSIVGGERLPDFDDRGQLPYVNCILKESLRFYPVFPIGKVERNS